MELSRLDEKYRVQYNKLVTHVIQSWEWGEFRQTIGTKLSRYGLFEKGKLKVAFTITFHKIPKTKKYIGYLAKGPFPNKDLAEALEKIAQDEHCAFIKIEPNIKNGEKGSIDKRFKVSPKPYFTKYNFILSLTPTEEMLLKKCSSKTRYNIRLALKKGVKVEERDDNKGFETHLKLYFETTKRQGYFGHTRDYHQAAWKILAKAGMARVLIGYYKGKPLSSWMLVNFKDTLYYPYGGSSLEHKEVMANNLVAWESIRLGKRLGLKLFDMWGALGPNPNPKDTWFGFHRFKLGYGGELVEYLGTYDFIIDQTLYRAVTFLDKFTKLKAFLLSFLG